MNTKALVYMTNPASIALLFLLCISPRTMGQERQATTMAGPDPLTRTITNMVKELNSDASALFELAGERFAANEKRGRTWILALHDASNSFGVLKYTDGKITVVALPVMTPDAETGLRRYVEHYNSYNVRSADLKVKAGRYQEARQLYTLLLHFDPHGSLAGGLKRRLSFLKKIEKGDDVEQNVAYLMGLSTDLSPSFLAGMEDKPPVMVYNVLKVDVGQ